VHRPTCKRVNKKLHSCIVDTKSLKPRISSRRCFSFN
jgi:hypothetical protein